MLAFDGGFLENALTEEMRRERGKGTHCVGTGELLFGCDDGAGALGGVEGGFAFHHGLALAAGATGAGFATDASYGVPVLVGHVAWVCVLFAKVAGGKAGWKVGWRSEESVLTSERTDRWSCWWMWIRLQEYLWELNGLESYLYLSVRSK